MNKRLRHQQGGLLIIVIVLGFGIAAGIAALGQFSLGQDQEAQRRVTALNQTAAIQYATDYQFVEIVAPDDNDTPGAEYKPNVGKLASSTVDTQDIGLESTCLADLASRDTPSYLDSTLVVEANKKTAPGTERPFYTALEHLGREFTTLFLGTDDYVELSAVNDLAYERVFVDVWFRVDYQDHFEDSDSATALVPLLSYYDADDKLHLRLFTKLFDCSKTNKCSSKGGFDYRLQQTLQPDTYFINQLADENKVIIHSTNQRYWQHVTLMIDLPAGVARLNAGSIASGKDSDSTLAVRGDNAVYDFTNEPTGSNVPDGYTGGFEGLPRFEKGGYWKVGDQPGLSSGALDVEIASVRMWRQPSLTNDEFNAVSLALYRNDMDTPGDFESVDLGAPDEMVLIEGDWDDQISVNDNEALLRPRWLPSRGQPALHSTQGSASNTLFNEHRQIFIPTRKVDQRGGPPAPKQLYKLYTCDDNGGSSILELKRKIRKDSDDFAVSWNRAE